MNRTDNWLRARKQQFRSCARTAGAKRGGRAGGTALVGPDVLTLVDYLADWRAQFDVLNHVQVRTCHLTGPHAHVQCSFCSQRFVLDLAKLDEVMRRRLQDHARAPRHLNPKIR